MATKGKLITGVIVGAIAVGGIAAYFHLKVIPGREGTSPVSSAKIVPDEALAAGYIDISSDSWKKLREFGTPEAQDIVFGGFDTSTADIKKQLAKEKIDFDKDVKPWLGSVMFAMVPGAEQSKTPELLVVVGIKDKLEAAQFANKLKDKDDLKVKEIEHKGTKILEIDSGSKSPGYVAILDNHLALSEKQDVVKNAIDSSQGEPSLASDADAAKALEESMNIDNPVAQIFIPNYSKLVEQSGALDTADFPPQLKDQLQQIKSVSMGMGIDNDGIRLRAITKVKPDAFKWEFKPVPGKIISQLPANTLLSANGGDLNSQWKYAIKQLDILPEFTEGLDDVRQQIRQNTQLDLDKDIIGWMDKEVGLALIPGNEGILQNVGFGGTFVFKTSDRKKAETTFAKLDDLAKQSNIPVSKSKVGKVDVTQWQFPPTKETIAGHGWLDNETVFLAIGNPIIQAMAKPDKTLDQSETFKAITKSLPQSNSGYFYINMDETNKVILSNPVIRSQGVITPEVEAILKSIRGVGLASTEIDKSTYTGDVLLALKPKP